MKSNFIKYYGSCLLVVAALVSCQKEDTGIVAYKAEPKTAVGAKLVTTDLIATVFSDTTYTLTPGVSTSEIFYFSKKGYAMRLFLFEIDLNNPNVSLEVARPTSPTDPLGLQRPTQQAVYDDAAGHLVWGGTNGSFFNTTTGASYGLLYDNGVVRQTPVAAYPNFFVITKDKKAVIGTMPLQDDAAFKNNIYEAIGGGVMLVSNNIITPQTEATPSVNPRTCIGVSADQKKVFLMAVDGRQYHYSNGMTYEELSKCMIALGAKDALNLDGGGSTTFFTRTTAAFTANRFKLRNWPSENGGDERPVSNSLLIISK
ncbi:MAG: phosphodiester glycosidase family protein [Pedobacter sp.]|nr:phosphodiester glycosidase family protein [Pedobacter sp.]